jgi:hypothetical protein
LGNITLRPSDKLFKSCPFGHILECLGVACAMPLIVDKIKMNLDFHIFDVLDLDLLLGSSAVKLLDASRGSLEEKLKEAPSSIIPLFSENSMEKPLPKQNLLEEMRYVSPFASSEPVVIEVVGFLLLKSTTRKILFTFVMANDPHYPRSSLSLFPLAHIMLLLTLIKNQHRSLRT